MVSWFLRSILALLLLWRSVHSRCFTFVFCPVHTCPLHLCNSTFLAVLGCVCGDQRRHESGSLGVLCFPGGGMVCRLLVDTASVRLAGRSLFLAVASQLVLLHQHLWCYGCDVCSSSCVSGSLWISCPLSRGIDVPRSSGAHPPRKLDGIMKIKWKRLLRSM